MLLLCDCKRVCSHLLLISQCPSGPLVTISRRDNGEWETLKRWHLNRHLKEMKGPAMKIWGKSRGNGKQTLRSAWSKGRGQWSWMEHRRGSPAWSHGALLAMDRNLDLLWGWWVVTGRLWAGKWDGRIDFFFFKDHSSCYEKHWFPGNQSKKTCLEALTMA